MMQNLVTGDRNLREMIEVGILKKWKSLTKYSEILKLSKGKICQLFEEWEVQEVLR